MQRCLYWLSLGRGNILNVSLHIFISLSLAPHGGHTQWEAGQFRRKCWIYERGASLLSVR